MNGSPLWIYTSIAVWTIMHLLANGAIIPPPWSDPEKNPCANLPGGWQLLYWTPLKKCFKIFTIGYPCPDTMELTPAGNSMTARGATAECRCPPGTAQSPETSRCHKLFEQGPCDIGQYFAPVADLPSRTNIIPKKRRGTCKTPTECSNGMVFWPQDSKCYTLHTRGPCAKGKLITLGKSRIAECKCENEGELAQYYYRDGTCHEHFTIGPCEGNGQLFLPGGRCGCHVKLPHYHEETDQCYEIGTSGPCPVGHLFTIPDEGSKNAHAVCQCKEGYELWNDGACYRRYTRGPCDEGEFIMNSTGCVRNPCEKGRLYFPEQKTCYRLGMQGPCSIPKVVVFDFTARPSIDGISYNGVCGCPGIIFTLEQKCAADDVVENPCDSSPGMVELNGQCYKLYTRGPCGPGLWLEPRKILKRNDRRGAHCQCRPGYTKYETEDGITGCYAPSVGIARYLNAQNYRISMFGESGRFNSSVSEKSM